MRSYELHGVRILECDPEGAQLKNDRDDFFRLKSRIAGEIIQKFVTYEMRIAIVGDISRRLNKSTALHDFVYECDRGHQVWFLANREELDERLSRTERS